MLSEGLRPRPRFGPKVFRSGLESRQLTECTSRAWRLGDIVSPLRNCRWDRWRLRRTGRAAPDECALFLSGASKFSERRLPLDDRLAAPEFGRSRARGMDLAPVVARGIRSGCDTGCAPPD